MKLSKRCSIFFINLRYYNSFITYINNTNNKLCIYSQRLHVFYNLLVEIYNILVNNTRQNIFVKNISSLQVFDKNN